MLNLTDELIDIVQYAREAEYKAKGYMLNPKKEDTESTLRAFCVVSGAYRKVLRQRRKEHR